MILAAAIFLACGLVTAIPAKCLDGDTCVDAEHFNMILTRLKKLGTAVMNHPLDMATLRDDLEKKFEDKLSRLQSSHELFLEQQRFHFEKQLNDLKIEIKRTTAEGLGLPHQDIRTLKPLFGDEAKENDYEWAVEPDQTISLGVPSKTTGHRLRRSGTEFDIGFFATREKNLPHQGQHQTVVFERVVTNVGSAYDNATGVFKAPVAGIYIFSTTVKAPGSDSTLYGFHMNGVWILTLLVASDTSSQTAVLRLNTGDDVTVAHVGLDHTLPGGNFCTFSGALLSQIYDNTAIVGK